MRAPDLNLDIIDAFNLLNSNFWSVNIITEMLFFEILIKFYKFSIIKHSSIYKMHKKFCK